MFPTVAVSAAMTMLLSTCGPNEVIESSTEGIESMTTAAATLIGSTTTVITSPPTTGFVSSTTIVDAQGRVIVPTTTTLAVGPPGTSSEPRRVVTSGEIIQGVESPSFDPTLGMVAFHVGVGAIVRFVMTPEADWRAFAGSNTETPRTADTSVLVPIVDRGVCPADSVCATFAAQQAGRALVEAVGISGCGTEACISPMIYSATIVVDE